MCVCVCVCFMHICIHVCMCVCLLNSLIIVYIEQQQKKQINHTAILYHNITYETIYRNTLIPDTLR